MQEDKKYIKGKVFCLTDTDSQIVNSEAKDYANMVARRLLLHDDMVNLVNIHSKHVSPATEIEDCLSAEMFIGALGQFDKNVHATTVLGAVDVDNLNLSGYSKHSLNLRPSEEKTLKMFFDENDGINKLEFAHAYNIFYLFSENSELQWVNEIKEFLYQK